MQGDTCYRCGQRGHWSWHCPLNSPGNNNNNNKKSLSPSPNQNIPHCASNPDLLKRMQEDTCYQCGQRGHWSWYCPLNSPDNNNNNKKSLTPSPNQNIPHCASNPDLLKRMQGDTCYRCGQRGHWSWYCPLNSPDNNNNNNHNKSLSSSPNHNISSCSSNPDLLKRMQGDNCYQCGQRGHWSWYCPLKSTTNNKKPLSPSPNNNRSLISPKMIWCRCGHGFCDIKHASDISACGKKYYACPIKRGAQCKEFVKWCDDPIDESDLQPPLFKYPECECGAGVCRRVKGTSENPHDVKYYFACPVAQDHRSCGYSVSEDELLNNTSIVPIRQSRQRSVCAEVIEAKDFLLSRLSTPTPSRIRCGQSLFQRDIFVFAAADSFGSCPMGWLGRLIFFHPTQSLKFPPPQPFFCCIFPSFDPIVVPKEANSECNDLAISRDVASPKKSPGSESKPMSKAQRYREVALFTQQLLLRDLENLDNHQHESMRETTKTTFSLLNLLGIEYRLFSDHIWDFISLASSMAEIDKSMENSATMEEHNKFLEEEKMRLAQIQDDCINTETLLETSNQQKKLLFEQVSNLEAVLHEKQNELKSCELETMKIETQLGDLKQSMLEVEITVKDRAEQVEVAREKGIERHAKKIAVMTALEKAKLALEN